MGCLFLVPATLLLIGILRWRCCSSAAVPTEKVGTWLPSDDQIMRTFSVIILALVFTPAGAQEPWLVQEKQKAILDMMPEGVPVSPRLKFYKLPQVYQSLYVLNDHEQRDINPVRKHIDPWVFSGGMHFVATDEWRNATALDLPEQTAIQVWSHRVDAGAPFPVTRIFWRFPVGTVAYDVLIRKGDPERVFEVRTHERLKDGWGNAKTYRPGVAIPNVKPVVWKWRFQNEIIEGGFTQRLETKAESTVQFVPPIMGKVAFVERSAVINDGGNLIPKDYAGAGTACTSCHSSRTVGARTGYGEAVRGGDGRFSWHPFIIGGGDHGKIDLRWPVQIVR